MKETEEENERRCRHYTFEQESAGIMKKTEEENKRRCRHYTFEQKSAGIVNVITHLNRNQQEFEEN
jgi:hypothetical protein